MNNHKSKTKEPHCTGSTAYFCYLFNIVSGVKKVTQWVVLMFVLCLFLLFAVCVKCVDWFFK